MDAILPTEFFWGQIDNGNMVGSIVIFKNCRWLSISYVPCPRRRRRVTTTPDWWWEIIDKRRFNLKLIERSDRSLL